MKFEVMIPSLQDITDSSTDNEMGSFPTIGLPCDCGKDERAWFYAKPLACADVELRRQIGVRERRERWGCDEAWAILLGEKLAHMVPLC